MRRRHTQRALISAAVAATTLVGARANAASCTGLSGTIPLVWVENGDTQEPLMKRLGQKLVGSAAPVRIVYKNRSTCDLASDIYTGAKMVNDSIVIRYIPTASEDPAWDPSKPSPTCEAD